MGWFKVYAEAFGRNAESLFPHRQADAAAAGEERLMKHPFDSRLAIVGAARAVLRNSVSHGPQAVPEAWTEDVLGPLHQYVIQDLLVRLAKQAEDVDAQFPHPLPRHLASLVLQQALAACERAQDMAFGFSRYQPE